jgi:hypothetical protein
MVWQISPGWSTMVLEGVLDYVDRNKRIGWGASVDDLVRVSRLLKYMCRNHQTGDAYKWSVEQVRRITGYSDDIPGNYTEFDDALRDGLRKLSEETNELNVCAMYRPGQASCEPPSDE